MAKGNQGSRRPNPATANRTARIGELVRRIVAEEMDLIDDDRLMMASITSVNVDRDLHKAVIWFTTLNAEDDPDIDEAFDEYRGRLRRAVSSQARLRKTPLLEFKADETLRSAERIETLLRNDHRPPVPDLDVEEG
ncbi:MAG: ribosome-binding factor A [Candidatus Aldehydirespiratoraceae bacterium]|jgi:ribosome-binding factor A